MSHFGNSHNISNFYHHHYMCYADLWSVISDVIYFWLYQEAHGVLDPQPGIRLGPLQWKRRVLTTGVPGNCLMLLLFLFIYLFLMLLLKRWFLGPPKDAKKKKIDYDSLKAQRMVSFFFFLFFGHLSWRILVPWAVIKLVPPAVKGGVLTTGPTRKSQQ